MLDVSDKFFICIQKSYEEAMKAVEKAKSHKEKR